MSTFKALAFDEMTVEGDVKFSMGAHNQVVFKFGGRGGNLRVVIRGEEQKYQIRGGKKVQVLDRVAHFEQGY